LDFFVLGSIRDQIFGTTNAAFNTQLRLEHERPAFGSNVRFDSICLHLAYSGHWGDSATMLTAHVYQLKDSLWLSSDTTGGKNHAAYYATDPIDYDIVPIGTKTFIDRPFDSVEYKRGFFKRTADKHAPFLSIRLQDDFGKKLLADSALFQSQIKFLSKYRGLRVAVEDVTSSPGKIVYFIARSPETKVVLYYSNADTSSSFSFPVNEFCIRFNNYIADHTLACEELRSQIANPIPEKGNNRLFLQPLNGTRIKVDFQGIEKLRGKNIAINEAKLFLYTVQPDYNKDTPPPTQLTMYTISNGKTRLTPDTELGVNYSGGSFNKDKMRYEMRISRYLQQRIDSIQKDQDQLYISISGASYTANNVVLYGNHPPDDESTKKASIRIIASKFDY
jgi:hypothetical protein